MFSPSIKDYYAFAILTFSPCGRAYISVYINAVALKQQNKRDTCAHMEATRVWRKNFISDLHRESATKGSSYEHPIEKHAKGYEIGSRGRQREWK